jgi:hypothetical protein
MLKFGKANFPVAFRPTSAFPLDARSVFADLASAEAAAASAKEIGSTDSVYHYGMKILVSNDKGEKWYIIQRDCTLLEELTKAGVEAVVDEYISSALEGDY